MLPESVTAIEVIKSNSRLHYRNRIQLHYNLREATIGFIGKNGKDILPVPLCQIMNLNVEKQYQWLLKNWEHEIKKYGYPQKGHVEIYEYEQKVNITWNSPYADQGFSQVNPQTNQLMIDRIYEYFKFRSTNILDLFGGAGNLTNKLKMDSHINRVCIDIYPHKNETNDFFNLNLFSEHALQKFTSQITTDFDTLFIDPPRSGFKQLSDWVEHYKPQSIVYVSCHAATMARDLKPITSHYLSKKNYLIDLFPSTYHYETMIFLEKA